jgi:hypothetical protein
MPFLKKDVNSCTKFILNGSCYQVFNRESIQRFLDCINLKHKDSWKLWQYKNFILALWFLPGIKGNVIFTLTTDDVKTFFNRVEIRIPDTGHRKKKFVISNEKDGVKDSLAEQLWDYLHLMCCSNVPKLLFNLIRSNYVRLDSPHYHDYSRKIRYHLPRWINEYNKRIGD